MRIDETVRDYNVQFDELMCALKDEAEKNHDFLRYLTFRLDFNGFHQAASSSSSSMGDDTTAAAVPQVHSVRPGSAVSAMTNTDINNNNNNNLNNQKQFYVEKTQPGTSAKVPVHAAEVLQANITHASAARYK